MTLTKHQQQVVGLVAQGLLYKEIAAQLEISEQGVQRNVGRIKAQLKLGSIADLTRYALAHGLAKNEFLKK